MTREEQKKMKELNKALPKILKEKIKSYKFKKKDYMIWFNNKDLFFELFIHIGVTNDNVCVCTSKESIKPLWLDDLLWDFLQMESNKKEPLSLRAVGAFTVAGSRIYEEENELTNWDYNELEKCVDNYLEHFYNTIQTANINTFLDNIRTTPYHQELRETLTYVYKEQYLEAFNYLKDLDEGVFRNGDISIYNAIRDYCRNKL